MASTLEAPASLPPAALVAGRFRVESQLGRGGMGSIYRVVDEHSGRKLALKRLRIKDPSAAAVINAQFEREYHTLSQLAHPRIIEVFDYGIDEGEPYYTMELLDGEDLFARGKLNWRDACGVLCDVASSLAILHSRRLLHRDVSARNVRLTADGRAKLIDFGAMAPMGPVKHVVGTPPFLPPESLQKQALDARSDLYALGALAYWVLTGRYAYPARTLDHLRELWQSPPPSPAQYGIELPNALNDLVMELLQLERSARPGSAAEVMERLSGIAGLEREELPAVSQAYLSSPMLVGRDELLKEVRDSLRSAVQGRGSATLVEGDQGTGRSRFLDACVLEAKLVGATVLRADASDGGGAEFGLARELGAQLIEALPDLARQSTRLWRNQLATLMPQLGAPDPSTPASVDRRQLQTALRNWVLLVARRRQLVIAVDDFDAIDEASAGWLSTLALAARKRRLSLVLTYGSSQRESPRLRAMRESARTLPLSNLDLPQTEALLSSVFGDVDHVAGIAARIYGLSQGNPRWTMLLAQSLVERKLARYEAGSWALPAQLTSSDLPDSLTSALNARIDSLPANARSLAQALSLTDPTLLTADVYPQLVPELQPVRARAALHTLIEREILAAQGVGHRFTQQELGELLRQGLDPAHARALHGRIAQAAVASGDQVLIANHLLQSGQAERAIEGLLPLRDNPALSFSTRMLDVLQLAADAARDGGFSRLVRNDLEEWLLAQAAILGRLDTFKRYAGGLLEALQRDSGLSDYLAADPALPEAQRLEQALTAARARREALPEHERGLPPERAALRLGRVCSICTSMSGVANDLALVESLPSLVPLFPICPSLQISQKHIKTQLEMQSGRFDIARTDLLELIALLDRGDLPLDPLYAGQLRASCFYVLGLLAAPAGSSGANQWLSHVEHIPGLRVLVWRVRMVAEVAQGNAETAAECRKRSEVLLLEDASCLPYPGTTGSTELVVYSSADDVVGTKRAMERLAPMGAAFAGWRPHLESGRAQYLRIQGDYAGALQVVEGLLRSMPGEGRHSQWANVVELHVGLLSKLGRHDEAVAAGFDYIERTVRARLPSARLSLLRAVAEALAAAGRPEQGLPLIEENLRQHAAIGTRGLMLGRALETRARVAIAMRDQPALREYAERCAREYKGSRNLSLSAKYERLMREAEGAGLSVTTGVREAAERSDALLGMNAPQTGSSRLLACVSSVERVHEGLRLLLENSGAETGFVFGLSSSSRLELRASLEEREPDRTLITALESYVRRQLEAEQEHTTFDSVAVDHEPADGFMDSLGRRFEAKLLYGGLENHSTLAGIAVLHFSQTQRTALRRDLLDAVGTALMMHDSVV